MTQPACATIAARSRLAEHPLGVLPELPHRADRADFDEDDVVVDDGAVPRWPVVHLPSSGDLLGAVGSGCPSACSLCWWSSVTVSLAVRQWRRARPAAWRQRSSSPGPSSPAATAALLSSPVSRLTRQNSLPKGSRMTAQSISGTSPGYEPGRGYSAGACLTSPPLAVIRSMATSTSSSTQMSTWARLVSPASLGVSTFQRITSWRHGSACPRYAERPGKTDGIGAMPVTSDQNRCPTSRSVTWNT